MTLTTRQRLLEAAAAQLREDGFGVLERGFSVDDIARRAGVSSNTFFNTFKDKPKFMDEFVGSLGALTDPYVSDLTKMINDLLVSTDGDLLEAVRRICEWDFKTVLNDPQLKNQMAAVALAPTDHRVSRNIRKTYEFYDNAATDAYDAVLTKWGASLRAPFTSRLLAVALTAVVEGLAMRASCDSAAVPNHLFGDLAIAIIGSVVDPSDSHEHVDDVVEALNHTVRLQYQSAQADALPEDPRAAVIDAARVEFGQRGYYLATLPQIAMRASVPLAALKRLFPTKASIIVEALRPAYERLSRRVSDDAKLDLDERAIVRRFLQQLAQTAHENPEYVTALMMVVAQNTAMNPETAMLAKSELDLPAIVMPVIQAGQAKELFSDELKPYDVAALLTNLLMLQWFTRKDIDPASHAEAISNLVFNGLLVRSGIKPN